MRCISQAIDLKYLHLSKNAVKKHGESLFDVSLQVWWFEYHSSSV